jgi:hypothetical protein
MSRAYSEWPATSIVTRRTAFLVATGHFLPDHEELARGVHPFGAEHRELPEAVPFIVANNVCVAIFPFQFEVPMVRRKPRVENFHNPDSTVRENQRARRLLASMSRVTLDVDFKELLTHGSLMQKPPAV